MSSLQAPDTYVNGDSSTLDESDVVALAQANTYGLPVGCFVGIANKESGYQPNLVSTDLDKNGNPRLLKTYGLLQLNFTDAGKALKLVKTMQFAVSPESLVDPVINMQVGAAVFNVYANELRAAAATHGGVPSDADLCAYVGLVHNWGFSLNTLPGIVAHGLDTDAFATRNAGLHDRQVAYMAQVFASTQQYPDVGGGPGNQWLIRAAAVVGCLALAFWLARTQGWIVA